MCSAILLLLLIHTKRQSFRIHFILVDFECVSGVRARVSDFVNRQHFYRNYVNSEDHVRALKSRCVRLLQCGSSRRCRHHHHFNLRCLGPASFFFFQLLCKYLYVNRRKEYGAYKSLSVDGHDFEKKSKAKLSECEGRKLRTRNS